MCFAVHSFDVRTSLEWKQEKLIFSQTPKIFNFPKIFFFEGEKLIFKHWIFLSTFFFVCAKINQKKNTQYKIYRNENAFSVYK